MPAGIPHKARSREESGQAEAALASAQEWDPGLVLVSGLEWDPVLGLESVLDLVWDQELALAPEWELALVSAQEWVSETVEEWETAEVLGLGPAWV